MKFLAIVCTLFFFQYPLITGNPEFLHKGHDDWELIRDQNDIKVYIHKEPRAFASIRILAKVESDIQVFFDYTHEVDKYPEWIYSCIDSKEIHQEGSSLIYSTVTEMPFPFYDRILTLKSNYIRSEGYYEANSIAIPSENPSNAYVEIPYFKGLWKVRQINPDTITIDYTAETEPGGVIPAWIYNLAVDVGPYKTMLALKQTLESK
jgi:hypothetical protein